MPDPYAPCPAGTGKKTKFCCPDLLGELDKIQLMLESEQRLACLEHIERLEAKFPDRACLLTHKAMLLAELGQADRAQQTLEHTLAKFPGNPVALAEAAIVTASQEGARAGLAPLHQALANSDGMIAHQIYDAIGALAHMLLAEGHFLAARAHLALQVQLLGDQDQQPLATLSQLMRSPNVHALFRDNLMWSRCPDKAPWQAKFTEAMQAIAMGQWLKAERTFAGLTKIAADTPEAWRNLAIMRSHLADNAGAVAAWRKLSTLDIPADEAIEAEAYAQLLDTDAPVDTVDVLNVSYQIVDIERLLERLLADKQAEALPVDQSLEEGQPPPRAAFLISDRPMPDTAVGLKLEDLPVLLGVAYLFGRQTDREARVELVVQRPHTAPCEQLLQRIAGDALGPRDQETLRQQMPVLSRALEFNFRVPHDMKRSDLERLMPEHQRRVLVERWQDMPVGALGGLSPRAAAADPANRLKLQAMVLILELSSVGMRSHADFDLVRTGLGLPVPKTIDPWQVSVREVRIGQLGRIDIAKLTDEDLQSLFFRAISFGQRIAAKKLGLEWADRPASANGQMDKSEVYGNLASLADDPEEALALLAKAREATEAKGQSPARWLLDELSIQLSRGASQEAMQILNLLSTKHINEPGVRNALIQLLQAVGALDANGRIATTEPEAPAAAETGKLWTPETAAAPAAPAGAGGSKIWLPGME